MPFLHVRCLSLGSGLKKALASMTDDELRSAMLKAIFPNGMKLSSSSR